MLIDMDSNDALDPTISAIEMGHNGRVSILAVFSYLKLAFHDRIPVRAGHAAMTHSCYPENTHDITPRTTSPITQKGYSLCLILSTLLVKLFPRWR